MKVLGAHVQLIGEHDVEFDMALQVSWSTVHSKAPPWRARGRWVYKVRALHMAAFPSLTSWAETLWQEAHIPA